MLAVCHLVHAFRRSNVNMILIILYPTNLILCGIVDAQQVVYLN